MNIRGINSAPLFLVQACAGKVPSVYQKLVIEELHLRGIVAQRTELITKTKVVAIAHEYPNPM